MKHTSLHSSGSLIVLCFQLICSNAYSQQPAPNQNPAYPFPQPTLPIYPTVESIAESITPAGLHLAPELQVKDTNGFPMYMSMGLEGTSLAILITDTKEQFVSFEAEESKINSFTDNLGTNLLQGKTPRVQKTNFLDSQRIAADNHSALCEFNGGGVPNEKASSISVSGNLVFLRSQKSATYTSPAMKPDSTEWFDLAGHKIHFKDFQRNGPAINLTLEAWFRLKQIREIRFLDEKSNPIQTSNNGATGCGCVGKPQDQRMFTLITDSPTIRVEFVAWSDVKKVSYPFSLTTTYGLLNTSPEKK